ncbi:MAG TPA: hypothetical protein VFB54_05760 [Burkholderiales bacterium]|nr:hypothetical protein [Burkholderiales bacterium]
MTMTMDSHDPSDGSAAAGNEDLFGKLDLLLARHQGRSAAPNLGAAMPTLTEAVDSSRTQGGSELPLLVDAVEPGEYAAETLSNERRRQLHAILYLRLRQRIEDQLASLASSDLTAEQQDAARGFARALRNALPSIVRDSVDQVLGGDTPPRAA